MKNVFVLGCLLSVLSVFGYDGRVYIDINNNKQFDNTDKPIANVQVTDGVNVVLTDKQGLFTLKGHQSSKFIYITTPSGYKNAGNFYNLIDDNKSGYDFVLLTNEGVVAKDGSHNFVHITDTEIFNTENHSDWVDGIKTYAKDQNAAFIIHTGDICYESGLNNHIKLMNDQNMGLMMRYCIGNHDYIRGGEQLYEQNYGPIYYSFEVGNIHYIVTPMPGGDTKANYNPLNVYKWLKNDLATVAKGKKVIMFNHDLFYKGDKFVYAVEGQDPIDFSQHNLIGWIYGHWHINHMKKIGEVVTICTSSPDKGGIDHSAASYRKISIDGKSQIRSQLVYPYLDNQLTVSEAILDGRKLSVSVNGYNTNSPFKSVEISCLIDGKTVLKAQLEQNTDWNWGQVVELNKDCQSMQLLIKAVCNNDFVVEKRLNIQSEDTPEVKLGTDWTNLLGSSNHHRNVDVDFDMPLYMAWTTNVKSNIYMASPIVYNGSVYVATVDENLEGKASVVALNASSGVVEWAFKARNSIKNTIVAADNKIFAQDTDGYLYAIDAKSGVLVWEYKLNVRPLPAIIEGLVVKDDIVYAGTGKGLIAVKTNGKLMWTNNDWDQHEGTTSTLSLGNDVLLTGSQWSALFANDAKTGGMLWKISRNGLSDRASTPVIIDNYVYVVSSKSIFVIDLKSGGIIVRKELPYKVDVTSSPLVEDHMIIFGTSENGIVAYDRETFEPIWNLLTKPALIYTAPYTRFPAATVETSPIKVGNNIICNSSDGFVRVIDAQKGALEWEYECGAPIFTTPAISGNAIFIADYAGNVYCFVR